MFFTSIEGGHILSWNASFGEVIKLSTNNRPKVLQNPIGEKPLFWYDIKGKSLKAFEAKLRCFGGEKHFELNCHVDIMEDTQNRPLMCFCVVKRSEEIDNELEATHENFFAL